MTDVVKIDNLESNLEGGTSRSPARKADSVVGTLKTVIGILSLTTILLVVAVCVLAAADDSSSSTTTTQLHPTLAVVLPGDGATTKPPAGTNICHGAKPDKGAGFDNWDCMVSGVVQAVEQSGANVTAGYQGLKPATQAPQLQTYFKAGMCPVNVHWHLGAEHYSRGQYDETGTGPTDIHRRRKLAGKVREGYQCTKYDSHLEKFTKPYVWKHCKDMEVGQTYEVHWPHSAAGACGTLNQFQTPFYDGVFCNVPEGAGLDLNALASAVGVQAQVFTIVNDESYYYPDLMRGMIVDGDFGSDMAVYTGSTTGTSRSNTICSKYGPITWQVDRKCHLISASTFDKMCADMKAQRDDMSDDLHAHGSRELVADNLAANNQQNKP
jgi:hypothetical protein